MAYFEKSCYKLASLIDVYSYCASYEKKFQKQDKILPIDILTVRMHGQQP